MTVPRLDCCTVHATVPERKPSEISEIAENNKAANAKFPLDLIILTLVLACSWLRCSWSSSLPTGSVFSSWNPSQCKRSLIRFPDKGLGTSVGSIVLGSYRVHAQGSLFVRFLQKQGPNLQMLHSTYTLSGDDSSSCR